MKNEIEVIHKDINEINKNNMIFFENINNEFENLENKISNENNENNNSSTINESLLTNEDINRKLLSNSINFPLNESGISDKKTKVNEKKENKDSKTLINNKKNNQIRKNLKKIIQIIHEII